MTCYLDGFAMTKPLKFALPQGRQVEQPKPEGAIIASQASFLLEKGVAEYAMHLGSIYIL